MTRYVLIKSENQGDDDPIVQPVEILGISASQAELNAIMQREHDALLDDAVDSDDSDAGHFYVAKDNGVDVHWHILPYETF